MKNALVIVLLGLPVYLLALAGLLVFAAAMLVAGLLLAALTITGIVLVFVGGQLRRLGMQGFERVRVAGTSVERWMQDLRAAGQRAERDPADGPIVRLPPPTRIKQKAHSHGQVIH